ncbi:GntR family transcriptional regulator [Arthrobacter sp. MDT1-48-3]
MSRNHSLCALRTSCLPPESLLPSESERGEAMDVSRTVVREALLLLEEDGLVRSRRGIGRVVSATRPAVGFERLRPMEQILLERFHDLTVDRTDMTVAIRSASSVTEGLGIAPTSASTFIESVLSSNGRPVALVQEHLPAGEDLQGFGTQVQDLVETVDEERTCLGALMSELGPALGAGRSELASGTPVVAHAKLLRTQPMSPVLIVTQTVHLDSRPFYLAEIILPPGAGPLEISHPTRRGRPPA